MTPTEAVLQAALDTRPRAAELRLELAAHLEEIGDERAEGYRVLGLLGRYPTFWRAEDAVDNKDAYCWQHANIFRSDGYGDSDGCTIGKSWFDAIRGYRPESRKYRNFNTRREAEDAAALAWPTLSPADQMIINVAVIM